MLKDKFKAKRQQEKIKVFEAEPVDIVDNPKALPQSIVKEKMKSGAQGMRDYLFGRIAEIARLRTEEGMNMKQAMITICPELKNKQPHVIRNWTLRINKSNEYKTAVKDMKKKKTQLAQAIVNKKLAWDLEKATDTLSFMIGAAKEIIEEDLKIEFKHTHGKVSSWVRDPDGNRVKKKRYLSDSAARALLEAAKELNKIYGLTKGDAPTENRYTQINFTNSELKE